MKVKAEPSTHDWQPTDTEIRERAYYLWRERGEPDGQDQEIWLAARELLIADFRRDSDYYRTLSSLGRLAGGSPSPRKSRTRTTPHRSGTRPRFHSNRGTPPGRGSPQ